MTKSISALSLNAHDIAKAAEDVFYMAKDVKKKSGDTKKFILAQNELADPNSPIQEMNKNQLDLW